MSPNQQRMSRRVVRKAAPPPLPLGIEHLNPDYQYQDSGAGTPLEWNLDENEDVTPTYAKFVFEDFEELEISSGISIMESNNGTLMIDIPPDNPFSQTVQRRPFDYEPFSDPSFPFNFLPYPDESLVEDDRVSESSRSGSSRIPSTVALAFVARVSVVDSETDVFSGTLDRLNNVDVPVEPAREIDLPTFEDIDWES